MAYGAGPLLREPLRRASPWQRYLIGAAMIAGGAVLVPIGHVASGLLLVAGIFLLFSMTRVRLWRRHERQESGQKRERP